MSLIVPLTTILHEKGPSQHFYATNFLDCFVNVFYYIFSNIWHFVIHGGIDGFSRLLVFLKASDNNRAETVLAHFEEAVAMYGVPRRVRVDYGGENNDLCSVMEELYHPEQRSVLRGKSTHNQRIERQWVDLWEGVSNVYYDLFYFLERQQLLDVEVSRDIWVLHFVFLPRINMDLLL